jgi:hAT family C-terminal dimerisation region
LCSFIVFFIYGMRIARAKIFLRVRVFFRSQQVQSSFVDKSDAEIKQKIFNVANQMQLPLSENVLRSWEMRRFADPQLFGLSQVVLAVPPTQVSVERAFSALGLILTARRNRLGDNTIDDLLICKLNPDILNKITNLT